jgi:hypothetical protein
MKKIFEAQSMLTRNDLAIILIFLSVMLAGAVSAFHSIANAKSAVQSSIRKEEKKAQAGVTRSCSYEDYVNRVLMY